jgi:hypothetical protein
MSDRKPKFRISDVERGVENEVIAITIEGTSNYNRRVR